MDLVRQTQFLLVFLIAVFVSMLFFISPTVSFAFIFACFFLFAVWKYPKETVIFLLFYVIFKELLVFLSRDAKLLVVFFERFDGVCIFVVFCRMAFIRKQFVLWLKNDITLPLFILAAVALASSMISKIVPLSIGLLDLFALLKGFLVYYVFSSFEWDEKTIKKVVLAIFVVSVGILFLGFVEFFIPSFFRSLMWNGAGIVADRFGFYSSASIFYHPGIFGTFMSCIAGFCFAFYIVGYKKCFLFWFVLFAIGSLMSMRLRTVMSLIVSLPLLLLMLGGVYKKLKMFLLIVTFFLFVFILCGDAIIGLFDMQIYQYFLGADSSDTVRNILYGTGFLLAKDFFPLGAGLGTFGGYISALYYSPVYTMYGLSDLPQFKEELGLSPYICDTFWPYIFGQFGFLGLVIYCWILFLLLKQLCLTIKQFPVGFSKIFALGSFILFVQSLVASIADPVFTKVPHNIFIFGCLGISYALARGTKKNEHPFNK